MANSYTASIVLNGSGNAKAFLVQVREELARLSVAASRVSLGGIGSGAMAAGNATSAIARLRLQVEALGASYSNTALKSALAMNASGIQGMFGGMNALTNSVRVFTDAHGRSPLSAQGAAQTASGIGLMSDGVRGLVLSIRNFATLLSAGVGLTAFIREGVSFNATMETGRIGIAATLTTFKELTTQSGRVLEGERAFTAATWLAAEAQDALKSAAFRTNATFQELEKGYETIQAAAGSQKATTQDVVKLVETVSNLATAIHMPLDTAFRQVSLALMGISRTTGQMGGLLRAMRVDSATLRSWQSQGIAVQEVQKRLEAFGNLGERLRNTFAYALSNIKDTFQQLSGIAMKPLADALTGIMTRSVNSTANVTPFGVTFDPALVARLREMGQALADAAQAAVPLVSAFVSLGGALMTAFGGGVAKAEPLLLLMAGLVDLTALVIRKFGDWILAVLMLEGAYKAAMWAQLALTGASAISSIAALTAGITKMTAAVAALKNVSIASWVFAFIDSLFATSGAMVVTTGSAAGLGGALVGLGTAIMGFVTGVLGPWLIAAGAVAAAMELLLDLAGKGSAGPFKLWMEKSKQGGLADTAEADSRAAMSKLADQYAVKFRAAGLPERAKEAEEFSKQVKIAGYSVTDADKRLASFGITARSISSDDLKEAAKELEALGKAGAHLDIDLKYFGDSPAAKIGKLRAETAQKYKEEWGKLTQGGEASVPDDVARAFSLNQEKQMRLDSLNAEKILKDHQRKVTSIWGETEAIREQIRIDGMAGDQKELESEYSKIQRKVKSLEESKQLDGMTLEEKRAINAQIAAIEEQGAQTLSNIMDKQIADQAEKAKKAQEGRNKAYLDQVQLQEQIGQMLSALRGDDLAAQEDADAKRIADLSEKAGIVKQLEQRSADEILGIQEKNQEEILALQKEMGAKNAAARAARNAAEIGDMEGLWAALNRVTAKNLSELRSRMQTAAQQTLDAFGNQNSAKTGFLAGFYEFASQIPTFAETVANGTKSVLGSLSKSLDDTFFSVLTGKIDSLGDLFKNLWQDVARTFSKMLTDILMKWLVFGDSMDGSFSGVLGKLFGGLGKSGGGAKGGQNFGGYAPGIGVYSPGNVDPNPYGQAYFNPQEPYKQWGVPTAGLGAGAGAGGQLTWGGAAGAAAVGLGTGAAIGQLGNGKNNQTGSMIGSVLGAVAAYAAYGAQYGAVAGYWGALIGAVVGLIVGVLSSPNTEQAVSGSVAANIVAAADTTRASIVQIARSGKYQGSIRGLLDTYNDALKRATVGAWFEVSSGDGTYNDADLKRVASQLLPKLAMQAAFGQSGYGLPPGNRDNPGGWAGINWWAPGMDSHGDWMKQAWVPDRQPGAGKIRFGEPGYGEGVGHWEDIQQLFSEDSPMFKLLVGTKGADGGFLGGIGFTVEKFTEIAQALADSNDMAKFQKWLLDLVTIVTSFKQLSDLLGKSGTDLLKYSEDLITASPLGTQQQANKDLVAQFEDLKYLTGDEQIARAKELIDLTQKRFEEEVAYLQKIIQIYRDLQGRIDTLISATQETMAGKGPDWRLQDLRNAAVNNRGYFNIPGLDPEKAAQYAASAIQAVEAVLSALETMYAQAKSLKADFDTLAGDFANPSGALSGPGGFAGYMEKVSGLFGKIGEAAGKTGQAWLDAITDVRTSAEDLYKYQSELLQAVADQAKALKSGIADTRWSIDYDTKDAAGKAGMIKDEIQQLMNTINTSVDPNEIGQAQNQIRSLLQQYWGLFGADDPNRDAAHRWIDQILDILDKTGNGALTKIKTDVDSWSSIIAAKLGQIGDDLKTRMGELDTEIQTWIQWLKDLRAEMDDKLISVADALSDSNAALKLAVDAARDSFLGVAPATESVTKAQMRAADSANRFADALDRASLSLDNKGDAPPPGTAAGGGASESGASSYSARQKAAQSMAISFRRAGYI